MCLLNGHEYYRPCPICGRVSAKGCDHRTPEQMAKIKAEHEAIITAHTAYMLRVDGRFVNPR